MALIDAPQFNYAAQDRQFGQFSSEDNLVKPNDVLAALAAPPASAVAAQANTPATNQAEQYLAYKAIKSAQWGGKWAKSRAWVVNQICSNDFLPEVDGNSIHVYVGSGNLYRCTTAGTSASSGGGPTGTGSSITDGTAVWTYYTKAPEYQGVFTS
jgi:hypothetical protein